MNVSWPAKTTCFYPQRYCVEHKRCGWLVKLHLNEQFYTKLHSVKAILINLLYMIMELTPENTANVAL